MPDMCKGGLDNNDWAFHNDKIIVVTPILHRFRQFFGLNCDDRLKQIKERYDSFDVVCRRIQLYGFFVVLNN